MIFNMTPIDPRFIAMHRDDLRFTCNLKVEHRETLFGVIESFKIEEKEGEEDVLNANLKIIATIMEEAFQEAAEALPELFHGHGRELVLDYGILGYESKWTKRLIEHLSKDWKIHILDIPGYLRSTFA